MRKALLFVVLSFLFVQAYAQGAFEINLAKEAIYIRDRTFYIESVLDNRVEQANIGTIRRGFLDSFHPIILKGGLPNSIQGYFDHALPKANAQMPIQLKVTTLNIGQSKKGENELGYVDLTLDYYHNNKLVFSNKQHVEVTDYDVMKLHEENIREALKRSLLEFNNSEWLSKANGSITTTNVAAQTAPVADSSSRYLESAPLFPYDLVEPEHRNVTTVGYQIGGYSLIGLDYEIRFPNNFGIHFGAGFRGYTYGLMIHTSSKKDSPYFNISFKDSGFGLFHAAGIEYGARWIFNKQSGLGLTFQYGIVKILKVDDGFSDLLFGAEGAPEFMMSMGVGLSW